MRTLIDRGHILQQGLDEIRLQYQVPEAFPEDVLVAAEIASKKLPNAHIDRTDMHFVTLDPATSVDLDQAFSIERSGKDILLHYAIADVAWFPMAMRWTARRGGAGQRSICLTGKQVYIRPYCPKTQPAFCQMVRVLLSYLRCVSIRKAQ
jgi:hypothetical protein